MTDREIVETAEAAFKAFDSLAKGQAVDITKTKTWKIDKQIMREICFWYIDTKRLEHCDEYIMNDDYTIIKRV